MASIKKSVRRYLLGLLFAVFFLGESSVNTAVAEMAEVRAVPIYGQASRDYAVQCQGCHGAKGEIGRQEMPILSGNISTFLSVPGGRAYLVQVPGVATSPLSDSRLADLLNWMLSEFDADNVPKEHLPYKAGEVGLLRQNSLIPNAGNVRAKLREAMSE